MAGRTLETVECDLKRVRRAERRLRRDWNAVHRNLARFGGLVGMPVKGQPEPAAKPTVSVYLRHQRELGKALKICVDELKSLEAEKVALALQVAQAKDEYDIS